MKSQISQEILNNAIWYYETHGIVIQRTVELELDRGLFRKLRSAMYEAGCEGIEHAIETELVFNGREEYFEVLYDSSRFANKDLVQEYVVKTNL